MLTGLGNHQSPLGGYPARHPCAGGRRIRSASWALEAHSEVIFTFMGTDPLSGWGLRPVELADQPLLNSYFQSIRQPLSDYTFSQLFSWRNSLRILWKVIEGHLCVFANGAGDLTLLMPPIGEGRPDRALAACWELMHEYNTRAGCPEQSRIEYASEELLARFDRTKLEVAPMGVDYLYDVQRMIDLAGSDLASKRQLKNRFMRNNDFYAEPFDAARHTDACLALLEEWKEHQDASHAAEPGTAALKRLKESIATKTSLLNAAALGYQGMVVYVKEKTAPRWEGYALRAFTFGEYLGSDQASIVIEKTDLSVKGLAQYIFSAFCERYYRERPLINAGDDWGLQSLAWTKMSYRPIRLLPKYIVRRAAAVQVNVPAETVAWSPSLNVAAMAAADAEIPRRVAEVAAIARPPAVPAPETPLPQPVVRAARPEDIDAAAALEQTCFSTYCLSRRQIRYLRGSKTVIFLVAEDGGQIAGQAIGLVRHHRTSASGRIYSLAVRPECRGRHIGQVLMQRMLAELTARGVRRVYLEVEQSNIPAQRLYQRIGFRRIGLLPDYYGQGRDGIHMMFEVQMPTRIAA